MRRIVTWSAAGVVLSAVLLVPLLVPVPHLEERELVLLCKSGAGDYEEVRRLLDRGVDVNAPVRIQLGYRTPLTAAIMGGCYRTVELLLARGADVNQADSDRWTPLMYACCRGQPEMVRLLLEAGADPNARDGYNLSALHLAQGGGHFESVDLLLRAGARTDGPRVVWAGAKTRNLWASPALSMKAEAQDTDR